MDFDVISNHACKLTQEFIIFKSEDLFLLIEVIISFDISTVRVTLYAGYEQLHTINHFPTSTLPHRGQHLLPQNGLYWQRGGCF